MIHDIADYGIASDRVEMHLSAYNAAFYELGLKWHWDAAVFQELLVFTNEANRIQQYIKTRHPHLLNAYDIEFLTRAIQEAKTRRYDKLVACGAIGAPTVDWAAMQVTDIGF